MSDFLSNLIARSSAAQRAIQPRLPSRFESPAAGQFTEVQSSAPATTPAQMEPGISPASKSFATDQPTIGEPIANAAPGSAAAKKAAHTNEATTISTSHSDDASEAGSSTKKTVVPSSAAIGQKKQGDIKPLQSFQQPSERPAFQARRQNSFSPNEPRPSAPAIHVTIGRVEVRAIQSAAPKPKPAKPAPPKLSLDDYLQKRDGGAR